MSMVGSGNGKGQELPGREVGTVRTGLCPEIWSLCRHVWDSLRTGARRAYLVLAYARWVGPPGPGGRAWAMLRGLGRFQISGHRGVVYATKTREGENARETAACT